MPTTLSVIALSALPVVAASSAPPTSSPPSCKYEENCQCAVPGITRRWQAAYCMSEQETDDLEHAGFQRCLDRPAPRNVMQWSSCGQNMYWKTQICRLLREDDKKARECARDKAFVPHMVEHGPGS